MVLTTLKQIKKTDLPVPRPAEGQAMCQQAAVSVSGYFYVVNLGPDVHPQHHHVGKDRRCTCGLGTDCPAVNTVAGFINFDMEGVGDKASASMSAPMLLTKDLLAKADEGLGILTGTVGETRSVGNRSGDITPFFLKGYPIVSIRSNGTRPPFSYHLPGDSLDIVQPPIMANITRLTYRYAFYLADR